MSTPEDVCAQPVKPGTQVQALVIAQQVNSTTTKMEDATAQVVDH